MSNKLSAVEKKKVKEMLEDPVKWARTFVRVFDQEKKKMTPWEARWYQANILRDKTPKKVARWGRRTGKSDMMCIDALHKAFVNPHFRVLFITPYENQVRLLFTRLREIIDASPYLKQEVVKKTNNPFQIIWKNNATIMGFTTGAASGSGGASIRGQSADYLYLDEVDYMADNDFDTIMSIAAEREGIGMLMSSTPTGRRGRFYFACTDKKMGFAEYHHPSTDNPNWTKRMEEDFKGQLSEQGYLHEILAEFGTQETGVFNKEKLDIATQQEFYMYQEPSFLQQKKMEEEGWSPNFYIFDKTNRAPQNPFRTVGVDFDKYSAASTVLVLDYDQFNQKFKVVKREEIPRSEYYYDNAINWIVEINDVYNPAWIYCDRGHAEYQVERLHIIGDENPSTGLKNKVKGWQFKEKLEIPDPVTKEFDKKPLKSFMVNQLQIAFERDRMILSPFDEELYKQLIDYEVVRITPAGEPVYTDKNEHSVDALGLAYLAFVLEFPELAGTIKEIEHTSKIIHSNNKLGEDRFKQMFADVDRPLKKESSNLLNYDPEDLPGDRPRWVKMDGFKKQSGSPSWGNRRPNRGLSRSTW